MSAAVRLAKEIDEPYDIGLPTAECQSRTPSEKRRVTHRDSRSVKDGGEDTEERVKMSHTENCEKSENYAKESQEAKINGLKQSKSESMIWLAPSCLGAQGCKEGVMNFMPYFKSVQ